MTQLEELNEIWKDIPGYGNFYMASSLGRIKCKERVVEKRTRCNGVCRQVYKERVLNGSVDSFGYIRIHIGYDGIKETKMAHSLVLEAFVGARPHGMECCHNNNNPRDNSISNLRWDSHLENNRDRVRSGSYLVGEDHKMAKYTLNDVMMIRKGVKTPGEIGMSNTQAWRIRSFRAWNSAEIIEKTT